MNLVINLEILFENTTKYTKSIYDEFLCFHRSKYQFIDISFTIIVIAFILFCLIIQIKSHHLNFAIAICVALIAFILWRFLRPASKISKEYKSDKIKKQKLFTFKFYDKFFTIQDDNQFSEIKYYELYRVFETEGFFYLYIDKTHSFLVDKSCFKENNWQNFSKFIKKKCWWCYRFSKWKAHKQHIPQKRF